MRRFVALAALGVALASPSAASAFGTVDAIGQNREHEFITRAALECPGKPSAPDLPGRCFQPLSTDEVAGKEGTLGAVGAPDVDSFFEDVPHCTGGDYLPKRYNRAEPYPHPQVLARAALIACWRALRFQMQDGLDLSNELVGEGAQIIPEAVDISACGYVDQGRGTRGYRAFQREHGGLTGIAASVVKFVFNLVTASESLRPDMSTKCQVIRRLGRLFHGAQDFYSHSNWTDRAADRPIRVKNPPGLGNSARSGFLAFDLPAGEQTLATDPPDPYAVDPLLLTTCYAFFFAADCKDRVDHDKHLGKDLGEIGVVHLAKPPHSVTTSANGGPRARIKNNFARAVFGARDETFGLWTDFGEFLIDRYGQARGMQMICAITHDDPVPDCTPGGTGVTVTLSHYHFVDLGFSLWCGALTGPPGATGTLSATGPAGYAFVIPFDILENGKRNFNAKITRAGSYTLMVEANGSTTTATYEVPPPPPFGALAGPVDCSALPLPPGV